MKHLNEEEIEELVWDFVCKYLENTEYLPDMLDDIGYVDDLDELLRQIDFVEVFDSELEIEDMDETDDGTTVSFAIDAILSAWHKPEQLLRITVNAVGSCLVKSPKKIEMLDIQYDNVECDDMRA